LTEAQIQRRGPRFRTDHNYCVKLGHEYLVLGLLIDAAGDSVGGGAWIDILMEPDIPTVISVPLCLFEIIDPRVSRYWQLRASEAGAVWLWPASFYREYYHDDLSNRIAHVVEDFWGVLRLLQAEATQPID
jgi:hypothetical protein